MHCAALPVGGFSASSSYPNCYGDGDDLVLAKALVSYAMVAIAASRMTIRNSSAILNEVLD